MALVNSRRERITVLCAMYVAQGLPWGFMLTAIVAYLTRIRKIITDSGATAFSDTDLGNLTAMIILPWTFKLVWAPLIDSLTIRSMGRRRPWILGAQFMMAVSLVGMLSVGELTEETLTGKLGIETVTALGWWFFIHNCFSSLQDVATDAMAVDICPAEEQGKVNGFMWGSKLAGKAFGAWASGYLLVNYGFTEAVMMQFALLLIIMLFPLLALERPGERRFPWSQPTHKPGTIIEQVAIETSLTDELDIGFLDRPEESANAQVSDSGGICRDAGLDRGSASNSNVRSLREVVSQLIRGFSLRATFMFAVFGVFAVVGWGIIEVVVKPVYTEKLDWTVETFSAVVGSAVVFELIGAVFGGWLADRIDRRWVMTIGFGLYGGAALVFGALPQMWQYEWFAKAYLLLNPMFLAIGAVGYNSMGMRVSWTASSATMFTIFMTLSNVGHALGNKIYGPIRDRMGATYEETFFIAAGTLIAPLLMLPLINPKDVDEAEATNEVSVDLSQDSAGD